MKAGSGVRWLMLVAASWVLASIGHPLKAAIVRNVTPAKWQAADVAWSRDVSPHNRVDDAIDSDGTSPTFDIVINYKRCVTDDDIQALQGAAPAGVIMLRSKYLTVVLMRQVSKQNVMQIASLSGVAFVERDAVGQYLLDVSVPTICVTPGSPSCAGNVQTNYGYDGTGATVAVLDSGVDNSHQAFTGTVVAGGVDVSSGTAVLTDPPDYDTPGHGTWVASIALGHAYSGGSRGVAPGARLVDASMGAVPSTSKAYVAIETILDHISDWNVSVITVEFETANVSDDGQEALSQLIDLAEAQGIVVVAAVGNNGPSNTGFSTPAAATRAITAAASDDMGTPNRSDDNIWPGSSRGKRKSDGDADKVDELKPEVAAPGAAITGALKGSGNGTITASGTSAAAPHVAGCVALIRQASPGLNPGSIKELIIRTAEAKGSPSDPATDPVWNDRWGWGLLNCYAAIAAINSGCDVKHPNYPANPGWASVDISTSSPPEVGTQTDVLVNIKNAGLCTASKVRVNFGVHVYSASTPVFHDIGTKIVDIAPGATVQVSMPWTPADASHQCLKTEIDWGPDTDPSNNIANRNVAVAHSPVRFEVQNTLTTTPSLITFVPTFAYQNYCSISGAPCTPSDRAAADVQCGTCNPQTWTVTVIPSSVTLASGDCPAEAQVLLTPPVSAPLGQTQVVHVSARIGNIELGGVSVSKTVTAPVPILSFWAQACLVSLLLGTGLAKLAHRFAT